MKTANYILKIALLLIAIKSYGQVNNLAESGRERSFNSDWKFLRDSISGAELPDYNDTSWMQVTLPHDYSIMDLPGNEGPSQIGPFSKDAPGNGNSTGHTVGGTGWYRKSFTLNKAEEGKIAILKFDGVYLESEVWVNGKKAGENVNGYTPFWFNITALLNKAGVPNVIAVKVENNGRNSRWYSGSGIYRNVHLVLAPPVHVPVWGVTVMTPKIAEDSAHVVLAITAQNDGTKNATTQCSITIKDNEGKIVGTAKENINVPGNSSIAIKKEIQITRPTLWSLENPYLYTAEVILNSAKNVQDTYLETFGIRSIEVTADKGFLLNGKAVLLKGGCLHHDNGFLGAAAIERAEIRKVELMKANGYNAIRCSHNPPSEAFLNACDALGMLVIDEFTDMWESYKNPQDYSLHFKDHWKKDLTDMILRDRNHPSIIMWSIGNEIPKENVQEGVRIGNQLAEHVRQMDPSRAVTEAINSIFTPDGWENSADIFGILDVSGYNYQPERYQEDHEKFPDRVMYGSESFPLDAYDYWTAAEKHPYVIGDFVWTSLDYIGEVALAHTNYVPENEKAIFKLPDYSIPASAKIFDMMEGMPSAWPNYVAWCGDFDLTGEKKPQMLYRDVLWDNSTIEINVHEPIPAGMAENVSGWGWPKEWPHWNWQGNEGTPLQVRVFTKAPMVRLLLNGKIIGEKSLTADDKFMAVFEVPFEAGALQAIAIENGAEIASKVLKTAGKPAAIRLTADRINISANPNDLSFVKIEVLDENGLLVPTGDTYVTLSVAGNGTLVGSGSADPSDMQSVNNTRIKTYKGKALAILRPNGNAGELILSVEADGLPTEQLKISTMAPSN